ncbi:peroxiredoxin [Aurantiacibacter rhizosphaerae]|uniref:Alkyl hydroperoxide reductase C n=1 Tax=Aurantiacibacter rhizosphaerae TaxID=2691582 RepID=A0A844XBF2_9SPHN|nr:peroxiredoxin [Aurantiacibacter rhizosphaerae]MWV27170.1 peroxiredoxin [Aurantiacibacter rhizosphaerae]
MNSEIEGKSSYPPRIGDKAPAFSARATTGPVKLEDFRGQWVILFSHPADFTPVCTSEFVALARKADEFAKRDCALMALSIDTLFSHFAWLRLIRDRFDIEVRFPVIEDPTMVIANAYGMSMPGDADNFGVRSTYFIDPQGVIRAMTCYPPNVGRSIPEMLRILDALQAADATAGLTPADWKKGQPMLSPPVESLDDVFAAEHAGDWFWQERK